MFGSQLVLSSIYSSIHRSEARFVARFKGLKLDSQTCRRKERLKKQRFMLRETNILFRLKDSRGKNESQGGLFVICRPVYIKLSW